MMPRSAKKKAAPRAAKAVRPALCRLVLVRHEPYQCHFGIWQRETSELLARVDEFNAKQQKFLAGTESSAPPPDSPPLQVKPLPPDYKDKDLFRVEVFGKGKNKVKEYFPLKKEDLNRAQLLRMTDLAMHKAKFANRQKQAYGPMKTFLQNLIERLKIKRQYSYDKVTARDLWDMCKEMPMRDRGGWTFGDDDRAIHEKGKKCTFRRFSSDISELGGLSALGGRNKWAGEKKG